MPGDEYASVVRGGLKLKGGAPTGIPKKKKKKSKAASESEASSASKKSALQSALEDEDAGSSQAIVRRKERSQDGNGMDLDEERLRELEGRGGDGKTASERAYEEMRRKRLHDRLQKEGVKTHKERVEELNKYLSKLSEHHDMYVYPPVASWAIILVFQCLELDLDSKGYFAGGNDALLNPAAS